MVAEATDSLNHLLEVFRREVRRSEVLNHIIDDEEGELQALLLIALEALRDDLGAELSN